MPTALEQAALLVAEGAPVAWDTLLQSAADEAEVRKLRDLQALAEGLSVNDPASAPLRPHVAAPTGCDHLPDTATWGHLRLIERIDRATVELRVASSIVPRSGPTFRVASDVSGPGPLLELRYRPSRGAAALLVDGRPVHEGYVGHRQFQGTDEGVVSFGVARTDVAASTHPAARFALVWLQIR